MRYFNLGKIIVKLYMSHYKKEEKQLPESSNFFAYARYCLRKIVKQKIAFKYYVLNRITFLKIHIILNQFN